MYAPGGFNAVIEAWSTLGVYQKIKLLDHLSAHFTCILFDRRECCQSGGWVEPITWSHYVAQGKGLLEHLHALRWDVARVVITATRTIALRPIARLGGKLPLGRASPVAQANNIIGIDGLRIRDRFGYDLA
jgi:hypothetical protein